VRLRLGAELRRRLVEGAQAKLRITPYGAFLERDELPIR
jgi:hypothetical protein